jgi:hypothetical protein
MLVSLSEEEEEEEEDVVAGVSQVRPKCSKSLFLASPPLRVHSSHHRPFQ